MEKNNQGYALIPLSLFLLLFLGSGIVLEDFYAIPSPIPALIGIVVAVLLYKGKIKEKINTFVKGCGDVNILTMCLIYLLAGAFTQVTAQIGALDSVVNLTLNALPSGWLYVGIFIISAIISTATGTSVGSIAALGGTCIAFASKTDAEPSILGASLLCGAMFGDNLSVVSDTTIAATQTMHCSMGDKMKENLKLAIPSAILAVIIYYFLGKDIQVQSVNLNLSTNDFIRILPYLVVIILATGGMHVFGALTLGIVSGGIIGLIYEDFTLIEYTKNIYTGFTNMNEIFILSLLIGGLAHMVNKEGGLSYIINKVESGINANRAYPIVALLVSITNLAVANNTIAILISSTLVKKLKEQYHLNAKKIASFMDIYACVIQGIIPYGAQILLILSFNKGIHYFEVIENAWYLLFLFLITTSYVIYLSLQKVGIEE